MLSLYINKQFDFSIPLTKNRLALLLAIISRAEATEVANTAIIRLLTTLAVLTAKAHFKDVDKFIGQVTNNEKFYLHLINPHIFKDTEEESEDSVYAMYQRYMKEFNGEV